ncbi:MAG: 1-acyl-sn-glycerol-3-phosphate acyltransferase [Ilumatobacteraceae bacterium]|nr:1-acyl-sn-glycerol-3-phosphate acyltransferase [Ilumatobacteraceae bacterium]
MASRFLRSGFSRTVFSIWSWFVLGVLVLLWLPMVAVVRLVTAPFDPGRYHAGLLFRKLAVVHQKLTPLWRFRVVGEVPPDPRRPYVVVANHESFVDILLISHLPMEMKWLSKVEIFKIPVVGWLMSLAGDIKLTRGDRKSIVLALRECRDRLDKKVSVMVFPEGTRSASGELGPFKDGAFAIAIEAGVPILPLVVHGARTALVKHDWRLGVSEAEVHILEPISTEGLTRADVADLRDRTRALIAAELDRMRATIPG